MYLSNYTDAALYSYYGVTLEISEVTPLGSLFTSETFYVPAYNEAEARKRVANMFKKSVLNDKRLTVSYKKVAFESADYNGKEYTTADGTVYRIPSALREAILETERFTIEATE